MKIAVLVDSDRTITRWQFEALKQVINDGHEINLIAVAKGDGYRTAIKPKYFLYYVLALFSRYRSVHLERISISEIGIENISKIDFVREISGMWEEIPKSFLPEFSRSDVVIKFGMGLLRNAQLIPTKHGVLSYHHGDPSKYRGRPAGFWESLNSEPFMGVMVQSLSNALDAGSIKAIGFSRVNQISYRKTLTDIYQTGIPLLRKAINSLLSGTVVESGVSDRAMSLPSNTRVLQLVGKQLKNRFSRYIYGAFFEKKWRIGSIAELKDLNGRSTIAANEISLIPVPEGYMMTADPCGELRDGIYCELLNSKSGLGEIGVWKQGKWMGLDIGVSGHASYPQIVNWDNNFYLFPEVSSISSPVVIKLDANGEPSGEKHYLKNLENKRLVDGTLFELNGSWYLFAGDSANSHQRLELYFSTSLDQDFYLHPMSPIVLDPRSSRMAGPIFQKDGVIYRFSQDCSEKYGGGVTISKITELTTETYLEEPVGSLTVEGAFGPHTVLVSQNAIWLDLYTEKYAVAAGIRRLKAKFS